MPAVSSCSAGRSSRAVSARRPAAPARIVRSTSERLRRVERAATCRALGRIGYVGDATEIGLGRIVEQGDRLGRLLLTQAYLVAVGRRPQALGEERARLARGRRGQPGQHGRQLQQFEVVLAHEASVRRHRSVARPSGASYDLRRAVPRIAATAERKRAAHRRWDGDDVDLHRRSRPPMLRLVPAARAGRRAGGA